MNIRNLSKDNLVASVVKKVSTQRYSEKKTIEGVKITELKNFPGEDGYFTELARLDNNGKILQPSEFQIKQASYSSLAAGGVKAWHIHFKQEDLWFVPPDSHVLIGLWDIRKDSSTKDVKMRIVMGKHKSTLLLIPRGVAHGVANLAKDPATLIYFTNQHFNPEDPDEHRFPWDQLGEDFWQPKKG